MSNKKLQIKKPVDEWVDDLEAFTNNFYENNPFYPKWPFGTLTKKHMQTMEEDNKWYQRALRIKEIKECQDLPPF